MQVKATRASRVPSFKVQTVVPQPQHPPRTAIDTFSKGVASRPMTPGVDELGEVKSVSDAFDALPASAAGSALVRRHTDNVSAWSLKWQLVTQARERFDFSYFTVERDAYGYAWLGAVLEASLRGVKVRGMVDYVANAHGHGFTGTLAGVDYLQELVTSGATIGVYNEPSTRAKLLERDGLSYSVLSSNHDKLAVADAGTPHAIGETGGRNVAREYHQRPIDNPASWRDDSLELVGPVTSGLVTALDREFASGAVSLVKPDVANLAPRATELLAAYSMMNVWREGDLLSPERRGRLGLDPGPLRLTARDRDVLRRDSARRTQLAEFVLVDAVTRLHSLPYDVSQRPLVADELQRLRQWANQLANDLELAGSAHLPLEPAIRADVKIVDQVGAASAKPTERYNELAPALLHLLRGAQKEVVIQNPYVVLTEPMLDELVAASKRGVHITIITNSPASTDSAITQGFFLNEWKTLLARAPTAKILVATGERKVHAKTFVIDGLVSADTSYNADLLSGLVNGEIGAISRSSALASDLLSRLYDDLRDPSNGFVEWSIARDAHGEIIEGRGPSSTLSKRLQFQYAPVRWLCELLTHTKLGAPLKLARTSDAARESQ